MRTAQSALKKDLTVEILRVFCTIVVVIDHVAICAIRQFQSCASIFDKFAYYGIQHWSHFAVPIFLMISGFLLLNPQKKIDYKKVITKYIKRMVVILFTVGTFFALLEIYFESKKIMAWDVYMAFVRVFEGKGWDHMWYLYVLIGIYLVLPIFKAAYNILDNKPIELFLFILFVFCCVIPILYQLLGIECGIKFPIKGEFLFYFLIGRWAFLLKVRLLLSRRTIFLLCFLSMVIPIFISYLEYYNGQTYLERLIEYHSPLIVLVSVFVVLSFKSLLGEINNPYLLATVEHLSKNSFGIYVFHMFWINLAYKFFHYNPISHGWMAFILLIVVVLILSDFTTMFFKKIPFWGKYI